MTNIVHFDPSRLTRLGWILHVSSTALFIAFVVCAAVSAPKAMTIASCIGFFFVLVLTKILDTTGDAVHVPSARVERSTIGPLDEGP